MVKVYYQDKKKIATDIVAVFVDEEMYNVCESVLIEDAKKHRCEILLSMDDKELFTEIED